MSTHVDEALLSAWCDTGEDNQLRLDHTEVRTNGAGQQEYRVVYASDWAVVPQP